MITKAYYTECPDSIKYMALPSKGADLWMRKNIAETTESETGNMMYEADEAYMRTDAAEAEITANFERWYEETANWKPSQPKEPTQEERIAVLEEKNQSMESQLTNTQLALTEIYENMGV